MHLVRFEVEKIEVLGRTAGFDVSEHSNKVIMSSSAGEDEWIRIYMNHY